MDDIVTVRIDSGVERALVTLTADGSSRSAAVRQAVLDAAARKQPEAARRTVLRTPLGEPDGTDLAAEISHDRGK